MTENDQTLDLTLEIGQTIPSFTLPGTDGMPHSPWDYKQRENLLLFIIPTLDDMEIQKLLISFAQNYARFREERCALLAITAQPVITNLQLQEKLHLPFPIVADTQALVFSRYTLPQPAKEPENIPPFLPAIVLADRYNALYQQWIAPQPKMFPTIDELLQALQYLNSICTP
jgi:peroxiredoxin